MSNLCTIRPLLRMDHPVKDRRASESSPEGGYRLDADVPIETTEQLRIAIDLGRAGDKVDVTDPAAAPLGTDWPAEYPTLQLRCEQLLPTKYGRGLTARGNDPPGSEPLGG
jgi:hypothetical protein